MLLRRIPKSILMSASLESEEVQAQTEVKEETQHSEAPQESTVAVATATVVETQSGTETSTEEETPAQPTVDETSTDQSQVVEGVTQTDETTETTVVSTPVEETPTPTEEQVQQETTEQTETETQATQTEQTEKTEVSNEEEATVDSETNKEEQASLPEEQIAETVDEQVTQQIDEVNNETPSTDEAGSEQTTQNEEVSEQTETAAETTEAPTTTEEVAQVAVQAATDAVKEAGAAEGTTVVTVVIEPVMTSEENEELAVLSEQIEADTEQASRVAVESEELQQEIEILDQSNDTLGKLKDVAAGAADNGGLTEDGARALSVAVESIYNRIGLETYSGIPSMESFSNEFSKVQATSIALEDIKEKMQAIGKSIVEGIKKVIEFLSEIFDKYLSANGRLLERSKKISEAVKSYEAKVDAKIESPSIYRNLAVGDSVPDKKTLIAGLSKMSKFIDELAAMRNNAKLKEFNESVKKLFSHNLIDRLKAAIKGEGKAEADYEEYLNSFNSFSDEDIVKMISVYTLSEANADRAIKYGASEKEGTRLIASPVFPGNCLIYANVNTAGSIPISFGKVVKRELSEDKKQLQVLSKQEIEELTSLTSAFVQSVKLIQEEISEIKNSLNLITKFMAIAVSLDYASNNSDKVVSATIKYVTSLVGIYRHISFGLFGAASGEGTRVFNAVLDYCQLSLNAGNKTSEDKKLA